MKRALMDGRVECAMTRSAHRTGPGRSLSGWLIPLVGLTSLVWVLARVIAKPSRATYPCVRAALPLASGFLGQLLALSLTGLAFVRARRLLQSTRSLSAAAFILFGLVGTYLTIHFLSPPTQARLVTAFHVPNDPQGDARGIFPGRVVWVHDPKATNESCDPGAYGHGWFLPENNDQSVIDTMLSEALRTLTGELSDSAAWQAAFAFHNNSRGKGAVGYASGEKVFIKINATSSFSGTYDPSDLSIIENHWYGNSETSPQLILALLRQLVHVAGVAQEDIYVGDPMRHIYKHCFELWQPEFPGAHYLDHNGLAGREAVVASATALIHYSDRGAILRTGVGDDATLGDSVFTDHLYTIFEEAEYLLNVPTLKAHTLAGVTMFAKNHFGSHTRGGASHLHGGLVAIDGINPLREGYGLYRVTVDIMGHELLGAKNLLYLMDALWTADKEVDQPTRWWMMPFDNDWTSSVFLSFDPVAIESVGFDFLRSEFTAARGLSTYPQMDGTDDYLHQAADSTNWPPGLIYDPENDGTPLPSLGVHEHWNNPADKEYSRNLGTGDGIELVRIGPVASGLAEQTLPVDAGALTLQPNYPNPFNPTTKIPFTLEASAHVRLDVYNIKGQRMATLLDATRPRGAHTVAWDGRTARGVVAPTGIYLCRIKVTMDGRSYEDTQRMLLVK